MRWLLLTVSALGSSMLWAEDLEKLRLQTHLGLVHELLLARDVSGSDENLQQQREQGLKAENAKRFCNAFSYSNCPSVCSRKCAPSHCSGGVCSADCDGPNTCFYEGKEEENFDINERDSMGRTALMNLVIRNPNIEGIQKLLNLGADLKLRDRAGESALQLLDKTAATIPIIDFLLKSGADLRADGEKVVLQSSCFDKKIYEYWQEKGLNLAIRDKDGRSAANECLSTGNKEALEFLFRNGVSPKWVSPMGSLLHEARRYRRADWVPYLLNKGVDRTAKNKEGDTVLQDALKYARGSRSTQYNCKFVWALVENGFKVGGREREIASKYKSENCLN